MFKRKSAKISLVAVCILLIAAIMMGCTGKSEPAVTTSAPTLFDRVNALETQARSADTTIGKVDAKVTKLESTILNIPSNQSIVDAISKVADIQAKLINLEARVNNLPTTSSTGVSTSDFSQLKLDVTNMKSKVDASANQAEYNALKKQVDDLTTKVNAITTPTPTTPTSSVKTGSISTVGNVTIKVTSYSGTIIPANSFDFAGNTYGVSSIGVSNMGSGYVTQPMVTVTNGTGTTYATAIISGGSVSSISIIDSSGYVSGTGFPTVTITGGGGTGATAYVTGMELTSLSAEPTITLKITNGESYDINNLIFDVYLSSDTDLLSTNLINKLKLVGTNATFRSTYSDSQEYDFEISGNGLSVAAGKTKYVYITPSVLLKRVYTDDVNFTVTVKIVDLSS